MTKKEVDKEYENFDITNQSYESFCRKTNRFIDIGMGNPLSWIAKKKVKEKIITAAIKKIINGKNPMDEKEIIKTSKETNISPHKIEHTVTKAVDSLLSVVEEKGIDDSFLAGKIKEGLEATKIKRASNQGLFTDEKSEPDFAERRQMLDVLFKLKNIFPKSEVDVNVNNHHLIRLPSKKPIGDGAKVIDVEVEEQKKEEDV